MAWYPIATEAVELFGRRQLVRVVGRWKVRDQPRRLHFASAISGEAEPPQNLVSGVMYRHEVREDGSGHLSVTDCAIQPLGPMVPMLVIARYEVSERPTSRCTNFHGHDAAATAYADAAEQAAPLSPNGLGRRTKKAETAELADSSATPVESGTFLLTPLASADAKLAGLAAAHQLTHAAFFSPRPWIDEGIAHFAQALYLEHGAGARPRLTTWDCIAPHSTRLKRATKTDICSPVRR